jgi:hypothetical protein
MATYGAFFALVGIAVREFARGLELRKLVALGALVPACAIGAALFDATENVLWLLVLGDLVGEPAPPIATACAGLKFILITLAELCALAGLVAWLRFRNS